MAVFENKDLQIFINGREVIPTEPYIDELNQNGGYIRLDYDIYDIPDVDSLYIIVQDRNGSELYSSEVLNIAQTGIFKIPRFTNVRSGITNPEILENREIRVYHVDSIPLSEGEVTSSFNIGDVKDVGDQCYKPDGIHPGFLHPNAIDYGRCEGGVGSTNYEIHYMGPYTMTVNNIEEGKSGISVYFEFAYDRILNYPLLVVETQQSKLQTYFIALTYHHLTDISVEIGDLVSPGDLIGFIGKSTFNTELHEQRELQKNRFGEFLPAELYPIPYKLTLSTIEGNWIESLINEFNEN